MKKYKRVIDISHLPLMQRSNVISLQKQAAREAFERFNKS